MTAKGRNGSLALFPTKVQISRNGFVAFLTHGMKGDKEIQISSITSIQWKPANSWVNGYIQFSFSGGDETKGGIFDATKDENTVMFDKGHQPTMEEFRERLEQLRFPEASSASSSSLTGELEKLAELHHNGVLTAEEFAAAKRRLLEA